MRENGLFRLMVATTPFHARTEEANQTGLWSHWAGYLAAERYQSSAKAEYFAIRNAAGLFDTSPLYKYRIHGSEAETFLAGVMVRDVRLCRPGRAQYTVWCDQDGHVIEDGVLLRLREDEFLLTAARPNLAYLQGLVGRLDVVVDDVSTGYAALAVQGPSSRRVLSPLIPAVDDLPYFSVTESEIGGVPVIVSRTGFTGDLGFELWMPADAAIGVWDSVSRAGRGYGVVPVGQQAILVTRIEAGLILIDVDYRSSRFAWTANERSTPTELGLGWMLGDLGADRPFIGRDALRAERAASSQRWELVGLVLDWRDWDARHDEAGLIPPKDDQPSHTDLMVYEWGRERAGWISSFVYSPMLQRHIGLGRVRTDLAKAGTRLDVEVTIDHDYHLVGAEVAGLPFYTPPHRSA